MDVSVDDVKSIPHPSAFVRRSLAILLAVAIPLLVYLLLDEFHSSRLQAYIFSHLAQRMNYRLEPGTSDAIRFPQTGGPYDLRLGYAGLPGYLRRLETQAWGITAQARLSPTMLELSEKGLFLPYREKDQAGLSVYDARGQLIYNVLDPQRNYRNFDAVPPLLIRALLYIENRSLLDDSEPLRNPAIEWSRFGRALVDAAVHVVHPAYHSPGGSTLATQIEKFRHSPGGRTEAPMEKLRQMLSASIRAYLNGKDTATARHQIVVDYLNTVPLAARAGFGEIAGVGDGMWAWYGRDFDQVNRLLDGNRPAPMTERALVFKEALSLLISQRSPSFYLGGDMKVLEALTDAYLRRMAEDHVIGTALSRAALDQSLKQQKDRVRLPAPPPRERKGANAVRIKLSSMLDVPRLYDLDRLDLSVDSTLNASLQQAVTQQLLKLRDANHDKTVGLSDKQLLLHGAPEHVTYSFTLIEKTPAGNKLRVQADNFDQPFDINEGSKLDLGSTAKLRTLVTYLAVIAELHDQLVGLGKNELAKIKPSEHEPVLKRWAIEYLKATADPSLKPMLEASLERKYSGNPGEVFFTGGGRHTFANFEKSENYQQYTVREATWHSVNLVYIRLMRDLAHYYMYETPGSTEELLSDPKDPRRADYLRRFADREGRTFLAQFYHQYHGKRAPEAENLLVAKAVKSPMRLAVIFRSIAPNDGLDQFAGFMARHYQGSALDRKALGKFYSKYGPDKFNLADRAYLAKVHPLELWLVGYQRTHPTASWSELVKASSEMRQESYQWLFKSRRSFAQNGRIRQILEDDAFDQIHRQWVKMGYPFDVLVPSYATAIGASADRPAALAALMGILVNDGIRYPIQYIDKLHFAATTPYETVLTAEQRKGERVLPKEIPQVVREVLTGVVDQGTARRVRGAFTLPDGSPLAMGGKTGTGDHRFKTFSRGGGLVSERAVSRAGAFVFYLGDHYFGTLVAYVAGPDAANYQFTSALPVQILKILAPILQQHLEFGKPETKRQVIARQPPLHEGPMTSISRY